MKKLFPIVFTLLMFLALPLNAQAISPLQEIKEIVQSEYVGEIKGNIQNARTINEAMEMLDPYSSYFTTEEYDNFLNSLEMKHVGIGVVIEKHEKGILITDVLKDGSAYENGIEAGDIITKVNSVSLKNKSLEESQSMILGEENTTVTLHILKKNGTTIVKRLTRKSFTTPNTTSELLYGNVGYIHLQSFSEDAADLVKKEYDNLKKQGAKSFILDLQNNGGGYVESAEELIALFKHANSSYKVKYQKNNTQYYLYYADDRHKYSLSDDGSLLVNLPHSVKPIFDKNTKLLVNGYSASASEMTAAALIDYEAAVVYGEKTYGKGTMQGFYRLSDGSYLKLTIGEFFGPQGTPIRDVGLTPHIETKKNPIFDAHYDAIAENLVNYNELKSLKNVQTTKKFTVYLNRPVGTINENDVELVALGGDKVDISIEANENQLYVTPKEPLMMNGEYMLIVHPTLKDEQGKQLSKGTYLRVSL